MFRRIFIEDWSVIFTLIAFATAGSVYLTFLIKALRMRPAWQSRLAQLPFENRGEKEASHE